MKKLDLYDNYAEKAAKIGVPKDKRYTWVEEMVKERREREERALAREAEIEERKRGKDLEEKTLEVEKKRLELAADEKKKEVELAAEQRKIEGEAELKRLEIQSKPKTYQMPVARTKGWQTVTPGYSLSVNQIDIHLERFGRHCCSMNWPEED